MTDAERAHLVRQDQALVAAVVSLETIALLLVGTCAPIEASDEIRRLRARLVNAIFPLP